MQKTIGSVTNKANVHLFAVPDSASDSSATAITMLKFECINCVCSYYVEAVTAGMTQSGHDVFEQLSFHWKSAQRTCSTDKTCTVGLLAVHVLWRHYID